VPACAQVRKPLWSEAPDGSFSLERPGAIVLEIAPVAAGSGTAVGARSYQWDKKQARVIDPSACMHAWMQLVLLLVPIMTQRASFGMQTFQLSHLELAGIIETCVTGRPMKDLFHDPNKGREWVLSCHLSF
jgi:hypothetical protein